jgi:hypothetical protein
LFLTVKNVASRTCSSLPLEADGERPRIDFVVFVVSLTDRTSEAFVRDALEKHVDFDFCFGRASLVATHADRTREYAVDPASVHSLASDIQSSAHLVSLQDRRQTLLLAGALVEQASIAARHQGTSAPLARSLDAAAFTLTAPALPTTTTAM